MWRSACSSFALALYLAAAAVLGRGAYDLRLAVAYVQVASLAVAALCWFAGRWVACRERRAERRAVRRWADGLAAGGVTKPVVPN